MRAISLLELNQIIGNAISSTLEPSYWIIAEIADLKVNQKGHCYIELVQKVDDKILAKNRATIWSYEYRNLSFRFQQATGEHLKGGMKVLLNGIVKYHEVYGLSLNIRDIDPNFTLGEKATKRKEILDRLVKEGLLDKNKQLPLPMVPQRIAIISSPTAAGFGDFMHQLEANSFGYKFDVKLFKAILQGNEAISSVSEALKSIQFQDHDIIVIIRGGGSQIDLDAFDSYEICASIAESQIPVITGIGHERDESIADLTAHTHLKTPTAVGEFLVDGMMNFEATLEELLFKIKYKFSEVIYQQEKYLDNYKHRIIRSFMDYVKDQEYSLNNLKSHLKSRVEQTLVTEGHNINSLNERIIHLNPEEILKKGYTLSSINGKIIKSYQDISGQKKNKSVTLSTIGKDFKITSTILETFNTND